MSHSTKKSNRARVSAKKIVRHDPLARKPKPTKKLSPRGIILKKDDDIIAKVRLLEKIGAYQPKKKITRQTITRSQKRRALKIFDQIQEHATYEKGHVIKPLKRAMHGYTVTKNFQFVKGKVKQSKPGVFKTRTGALIEKPEGTRAKILQDGTIVSYETRYGKRRKVYTGSLNHAQTLRFLEDAENGKIKFPPGMQMSVAIFGNMRSARLMTSPRQLAKWVMEYAPKLTASMSQYPNDPAPLEIEFFNATI